MSEEIASRRRFALSPFLLAGWLLLIFGTSCTVILPEELFAWL